jgi:hypothetical protein
MAYSVDIRVNKKIFLLYLVLVWQSIVFDIHQMIALLLYVQLRIYFGKTVAAPV